MKNIYDDSDDDNMACGQQRIASVHTACCEIQQLMADNDIWGVLKMEDRKMQDQIIYVIEYKHSRGRHNCLSWQQTHCVKHV